MSSVEVGQVYKVRCVPAAEAEWERLKVVGQVPAPPGEPVEEWAVQIAGIELETRDISDATLKADCDLEPSA
jgi:hypothetical protein